MAEELMLRVEDVYKKYRLGVIGGGTLSGDLQSWWAKVRHKDDPNRKIGEKAYGKNEEFYALRGISFEVKKGEAVGIIGGNGAGKSTTLKILSQVTAPTRGKVYLNGRITSMLEVGTGFHPELTGRENIYLNGAILGMTKAEIDEKMEDIIEFSECRQFIDTPVKRYSSGMYVKLAFSVAAHLDSEIMVMDEVLAVGDVNFQQKCLKKMRQVAKEEGRTILYVSHNMSTIRALCDRCIVLSHGELIYDGDVETAIGLYSNKQTEELKKHYDIEHKERIAGLPQELLLKSVDIVSCDRKELVFDLGIDAKRDMDEVLLRFGVLTLFAQPVGLAYTEMIKGIKKGENKYRISFDTTNLSVDRYSTKLIICEWKDGAQQRQDVVEGAFDFEINGNKYDYNVEWYPSGWGYVHFDDAKAERLD